MDLNSLLMKTYLAPYRPKIPTNNHKLKAALTKKLSIEKVIGNDEFRDRSLPAPPHPVPVNWDAEF